MVKLSLEELLEQADTVVVGTVAGQTSTWNNPHTAILTDSTVVVEQVIKGSPVETVTVRTSGGMVGKVGLWVEDEPPLRIGEEAVLFLDTRQMPARVVGAFQGMYVVRDGTVTWEGRTVPLAEFLNTIQTAILPIVQSKIQNLRHTAWRTRRSSWRAKSKIRVAGLFTAYRLPPTAYSS